MALNAISALALAVALPAGRPEDLLTAWRTDWRTGLAPGIFSTFVDLGSLERWASTPDLPAPPIVLEALDLLAAMPDSEAADAGCGFPNNGRRLCLRMRDSEFEAGKAVTAWGMLLNVTGTNWPPTKRMVGDPWDAVMTTADNRVIQRRAMFGISVWSPPLPPPQTASTPRSARRHPIRLQPERVKLHVLCLSAVYDLTQPGTYYVTVSRRIPGAYDGESSQVSASTSFRIVAQPEKPSAANGELPASSGATSSPEVSNSEPTPISTVLSTPSVAKPTASVAMTLPGAETAATSMTASADVPGNEPLANSALSNDEAGSMHLGNFSGPLRIGVAVLVLLLASAVVFLVIRHARRHW